MSKSEKEMNDIPEWDVFKRIDELETVTLKIMDQTDKAEPTLKEMQSVLKDFGIISRTALMLSFMNWARVIKPQYVRKHRDMWLKYLKDQQLSETSIEWVNEMMTQICEIKEK